MKTLKISANNEISIIDVNFDDFRSIQKALGGYFETVHTAKMGNYFRFLPFTVFLAVNHWYGQRMKLAHEMILYRKKIAKLYDTYMTFSTQRTKCRCRALADARRYPKPRAGLRGLRRGSESAKRSA